MKTHENTQFVIVGMAGSGKTTFCQRVVSWLMEYELKTKINNLTETDHVSPLTTTEIVNLDPAVLNTKIPSTIDIRDHIDFDEVMEKYDLGPNGAILTCLNLFFMKNINFNLKKYTVFDAPGQIDALTWCSPAKILYTKPNTIILFVIDSSEQSNAYSMIANLIFAASLKEKYKNAKVLLVFNKMDINVGNNKVEKYLDHFYVSENIKESDVTTLSTFFSEFWENMDFIKVSSKTGEGKKAFYDFLEEYIKNKL
ncbi:ATP-GTP-binding protein [Ecytonucleospora hepatopenaei]|uniref:GPN-loop GTPase n=1 Tax=Ecytonucleospora hepatopenaei TaxID=646526 RepID=A0A1W0E7K1_9MICR|nr:ATP-GTP-binding protein [Ecytonucleospora hepatopenaei]